MKLRRWLARRPDGALASGLSKAGKGNRVDRMKQWFSWDRALLQRESGQTLVEYALIISFVAIALVVALGLLAGGLNDFYQTAAEALP
jgi:Flp pilus assembly pilin Flp